MTTPQQTLGQSAAPARNEEAALARTNVVGFSTIVIREFNRIIRIWGQTIVPPAITATLYFIIFGSLIGSRIGDMGGYTYIQYIAPGLIMMSVITNSYGNVVSSFFGAKFGKHIEELLVSPLPNWLIVTGYMMGGILRGLIVGGVVTIITLIFTHLHVHNVLVVMSAVLLSSIVFALAGMINAVFAKNFDQISFIPTFVLTPLTYLGGVFYTIKLLPEWAQGMSHANPDPLHGERVPLRLPRRVGRRCPLRIRHDDRRGGRAVRELRVVAAAGSRNEGVRCPHSRIPAQQLQPDSSSSSPSPSSPCAAGSRISFSQSLMISRASVASSSATATATRPPSGSSPAPLCRNSPWTCACTPACSSTCMTMCASMLLAAW